MSVGFINSIKVPRIYKIASAILQKVSEEGESLKQVLFQAKHPNIKGIHALVLTSIQRSEQLNVVIRNTRILLDNDRFDPWLARILITELLWGKQKLPSGCKPINTVLLYEKQLRDAVIVLNKNQGESDEKEVQKWKHVRVNTLKTTVNEMISYWTNNGLEFIEAPEDYDEYLKIVNNLQPNTFVQDINIPELLIFPPKTYFHDTSEYKNGYIILQDKASCLPSYLLNPTPGSVVLDMCAAPGMKTTHLASIMKNQGKIYAVEMNKERFKTLNDFVNHTNSSCVEPMYNDSFKMNDKTCPDVEYILVDPSCSGSGMIERLSFKKVEQMPPQRILKLQEFQILLLTHALLGFSKVKRVVYSTCSVNSEENEKVVDTVMETVGNAYKLKSVKKLLKRKWKNYSSMDFKCGGKCLYAKYDIDKTNGFFVAVFERNEEEPLPPYKRNFKSSKAMKNEKKQFRNEQRNNENNGCENKDDIEVNEKKLKKNKRKISTDIDSKLESDTVNETSEQRKNDLEDQTLTCADSDEPKKKKKKKKHVSS